jgi:hypothetical protein
MVVTGDDGLPFSSEIGVLWQPPGRRTRSPAFAPAIRSCCRKPLLPVQPFPMTARAWSGTTGAYASGGVSIRPTRGQLLRNQLRKISTNSSFQQGLSYANLLSQVKREMKPTAVLNTGSLRRQEAVMTVYLGRCFGLPAERCLFARTNV